VLQLRRDELADLLHRHGQVRIAQEQIFTPGFLHTPLYGKPLAALLVADDMEVLMPVHIFFGDLVKTMIN
jgi:hypothetical protein